MEIRALPHMMFWYILIFVVASSTSDQEINIRLLPRGYSDPRTTPNFTCGCDPNIDPEKLAAEQNAAYILDVFDNTQDESEAYRTEVFDVISFSQSGSPVQLTHADKYSGKDGLYSLFLVPAMRQCNVQVFEDAAAEGQGYYPVYASDSNVLNDTEILDKFKADAPVLKKHFSSKDVLPKLCGSYTPMLPINRIVAASNKNALLQVFNFYYNEERDAGSFNPSHSTNCRNKEETEESLRRNLGSETVYFEKREEEVNESEGFLEVKMKREVTGSKNVAFIETVEQSADATDFVPFKGPVVFKESMNTTSFFIRLKNDNDTGNETFSINIRNFQKRKKRAASPWFLCGVVLTDGSPKSPIDIPKEPEYSRVNIAGTMCPVEKAALVEFDNEEDGPFRQRHANGKPIEHNGKEQLTLHDPGEGNGRTSFKSTYSSTLNIPLRSVVTLIAADVYDSVKDKLKSELKRNYQSDFKVDLREKARPITWAHSYNLANTFNMPELLSTKSQNTDYSNPQKYDNNYYGYTKGHLLSATFMLHFFAKDHPDVVYDHASYLTNIFPQVADSNNNNNNNGENWHSQESSEYSAAHHCLKTGNNFHVAHGTIPSGPLQKEDDIIPQMCQPTKRDFRMMNDNYMPIKDKPQFDTRVNIPRYFYMAYCCSDGEKKYTKTTGNNQGTFDQQKFLVFEQSVHEEFGEKVPQEKGDKIIGSHDTAAGLLDHLKLLWKTEHPSDSSLNEPILFSEITSGTCGGFDLPAL